MKSRRFHAPFFVFPRDLVRIQPVAEPAYQLFRHGLPYGSHGVAVDLEIGETHVGSLTIEEERTLLHTVEA